MTQDRFAATPSGGPITAAHLTQALTDLGVFAGDTVLLHCALTRLGFIAGGVQTVLETVLAHLGARGTLVTPGFSAQLADPRTRDIPYPAKWLDSVMAQTPLFDLDTTPTRAVGKLAEAFRALPSTQRSPHPIASFLANGRHAAKITLTQPIGAGLGRDGPMGRLFDLDTKVVFLGSDWATCTCFHLAEYGISDETVYYPTSRTNGVTQWEPVIDCVKYNARFAEIGAAFEATDAVTTDTRFAAPLRVFSICDAVNFAHDWLRDPQNGVV
jgi:aminoglycoside 3-N-acetyltransferase